MDTYQQEVLTRLTAMDRKLDYLTARHQYVEQLVTR